MSCPIWRLRWITTSDAVVDMDVCVSRLDEVFVMAVIDNGWRLLTAKRIGGDQSMPPVTSNAWSEAKPPPADPSLIVEGRRL